MNAPHYRDDAVTLYHGDCLDVLAELPDASVDSVVTDPPYGLEFMGKDWDAPWKKRGNNPASAGMSRAGYAESNGYANRETPTYGRGWRNLRCQKCGHITSGGSPCRCPDPELVSEGPGASVAMSAFQSWCELWARECLRVLKPGGHLLAFGGTRTWHRLACAVEDAGFEVRDSIAWLYGSGFPKSLDVSKAIDRAAGAEREVIGTVKGMGKQNPDWNGTNQGRAENYFKPEYEATIPATDDAKRWQGWGTALKPAFEPVVVARKPLSGTVAGNVLAHGVGALNIDGCRVATTDSPKGSGNSLGYHGNGSGTGGNVTPDAGRWPSNVVIDGHAAAEIDRQSGNSVSATKSSGRMPDIRGGNFNSGQKKYIEREGPAYGDEGGASRFFPTFRYNAKAPTEERPTANGIAHPTVKPLDLMRWLVRLVTPPGGTVLEPFDGSGTTAEACIHEHMRCVAIEREADYLPLIVARLTKPIEIGFDFNT